VHTGDPGVHVYNLGTGHGVSVLQMRDAFEKACGRPIPFELTDRRPGDVGTCYADATKAAQKLNWKARLTLSDMTADTWRWQSQNPDGLPDA
jgi:UDP-glucose 4-epimerase